MRKRSHAFAAALFGAVFMLGFVGLVLVANR